MSRIRFGFSLMLGILGISFSISLLIMSGMGYGIFS